VLAAAGERSTGQEETSEGGGGQGGREKRNPLPDQNNEVCYRRFTRLQRVLHLIVMTSFLGLVLTGMPLKYSETDIVLYLTQFVSVLGLGFIHRVCAFLTFGYFIFNLFYVGYRFLIKRESGLLWGPESMVPQPGDLKLLIKQMRWFFFLGEKPQFDRWAYWEKFDYWAIFWGVPVIGATGLFLWFPTLFGKYLPGWIFNLAALVHSEEALMAAAFIFTIHFFNTHLRPGKFPLDLVIFTGRMSESYFKEEHPVEYNRLAEKEELETLRIAPSGRDMLVVYKIIAYAGLVTGLFAIAVILYASWF
jgi:cytochrome b subunit of formate dehydrogenase